MNKTILYFCAIGNAVTYAGNSGGKAFLHSNEQSRRGNNEEKDEKKEKGLYFSIFSFHKKLLWCML
ncbi:hypothetical protein DQQ01_08025 [Blautia argi]|uniref:Uncharacterized protein n=1 Tax=Blautia argi TaxID=1912897 RepID=A0A2Z4UAN3_9FIRM|nr:hypothetical protein DQQ01_08025 [Blautia argi]